MKTIVHANYCAIITKYFTKIMFLHNNTKNINWIGIQRYEFSSNFCQLIPFV